MTDKAFQKLVFDFYKKNKRSFPWRETKDPYAIFISEVMLQQTHAPRVVAKFVAFMKKFPTVQKLAKAKDSDIIREWQGLGYNRRALNLVRAAREMVTRHNGAVPRGTEALVALPGIGPYTAAAIRSFAFNSNAVVIETNIRSVCIHYFFPERLTKVTDAELLPIIERTFPKGKAREWYAALMDLGAKLKKEGKGSPSRTKVYTKQSTFKGSNRALRGMILREAARNSFVAKEFRAVGYAGNQIRQGIADLIKEGFIVQKRGKIYLK